MSFAKHKTIIEENDTVILYLTISNIHAIDVTPQVKNKRGELIENIFQTTFGSLKVKNLIGVKYGSKVIDLLYIMSGIFTSLIFFLFSFSFNRLNCQKDGHMCYSQHQNCGHKHCHIEHKLFTHPTLV